MILIVIDRLTKMARFIPTHSTVTSKGTADLFLREVFRHHGLPSNIVSDRDPRFTAKFWKALQKALGVQLLMSTAAHPQTDGQSEAAVKVIQKLLKPFVFQGQDWEELLPSLEFAGGGKGVRVQVANLEIETLICSRMTCPSTKIYGQSGGPGFFYC